MKIKFKHLSFYSPNHKEEICVDSVISSANEPCQQVNAKGMMQGADLKKLMKSGFLAGKRFSRISNSK